VRSSQRATAVGVLAIYKYWARRPSAYGPVGHDQWAAHKAALSGALWGTFNATRMANKELLMAPAGDGARGEVGRRHDDIVLLCA